MAVFLVLLATVIVVVIGRQEMTDELVLLDTTTVHCRTTVKLFYTEGEGEPPYPVCSTRCIRSEDLWIDGVVFKRLAELEAYGLMVEMIYINGSLSDCKMVPYETGEETAARQEAQKRSMDSCSSIENGSKDKTPVPGQTERIPISPIPIHKRLEGFSRVGNSYYMVSPEVMAYHDAGPYCESLGATLASVESPQEQNLLQGILATGVWRARNDDILVDTPDTRSNALCEHPVVDDSNQYSCPDGYWKYKSSCYVLSNDALPYSEGEKFCSNRGAYPVFINSQEENDFITGKFRSFHFIGYTDMVEEGKFVSKRFGFPLFTRWSPDEPDDFGGKEDCAAIAPEYSMLWTDVPCSSAVKMLCEKSADIVE